MKQSLLILLGATSVASAVTAQNTWITWDTVSSFPQSVSTGQYGTLYYATSATGHITLPTSLGSTVINVTYTGEVLDQSRFSGSGLNPFTNSTSFFSNSVTTGTPPAEYIALSGYSGLTNTLTFSAPVTNLVMAIGSLGGQQDGAYQFDHEFVVDSRGAGNWGNYIINLYAANNNTMAYGQEANGAIQFNGTLTSLSWTIPNREYYSVFTIGASDTPGTAVPGSIWQGPTPTFNPVPEPSTYGLALGGLALVGAIIRRRKISK